MLIAIWYFSEFKFDINKSKLYPIKKWLEDFDKNRELYKSNIKKAKKDKYVDILDIDEIDDNNTDDIILPKKNNNSSNKSCLIITGNHGIGKTHFLVSILNSLKYDIYKINFIKVNNIKNINEFIEKTIFGISISDRINNVINKKKIILIDNLECISSNNEKNLLKLITKLNDINWYLPVIFISNNEHNKLIYFIKKNAYEIQMYNPTREIMENICCKICLEENINLTNEKVLEKIINYSHNDIRSIITLLQSIKIIYGDNHFSCDDFENFIQTCKMKDIDYHIFDGAQKLFFGFDNIDMIFATYNHIFNVYIHLIY